MNHIKKLLEYTNYADDMANKVPKELIDTDLDGHIKLLDSLKPKLRGIMDDLIEASTVGDADRAEEILRGFNTEELRIIQNTIDTLNNSIASRIRKMVTQN